MEEGQYPLPAYCMDLVYLAMTICTDNDCTGTLVNTITLEKY